MTKRKKNKPKEEQYPESLRFWVIYDIVFFLSALIVWLVNRNNVKGF